MKTKLALLIFPVLTILSPIKPLLIVAMLSIFTDVCFGIWRSYKKRENQQTKFWDILQSKGLYNTAVKCFTYAGSIIFFYLIEKYIAGDIIAHFISIELLLTKAVALFFVFIEVKSMNESYKDVTGKDILASFKKFIGGLKSQSDKWS